MENLQRIKKEARDRARKETAKELLQDCLTYCKGQGGVCYDIDIVKEIAPKYGVKLEA